MRLLYVLSLACLLLGGAAGAASTTDSEPVPLYDDLGDHKFPVTTSSPEAQSYFNQGIRLTYAFNHGEAIRSFARAAELDPACAMCQWGIALAYGPNINMPMPPEAVPPAMAALQRAQALAEGVSAREQAYIAALAQRYRQPAPDDRSALDAAYARGMATVAAAYPEDHDAAVLYAEALMNLSPWDYWQVGERPKPNTRTIMTTLERVLASNPNHPGACHYYIHTVESARPQLAEDCADRLAGLMPGAGHLVHMPAHIYIRIGRWDDAIEANRHAVHADEEYLADRSATGLYPSLYYPHNYHFLAFAAAMDGRAAEALSAADALAAKVTPEVARAVPELQGMVVYPQLVRLGFGRMQEVLAAALPPADLPMAHGLGRYARGVAMAATGRLDEARAAQQAVAAAAGRMPDEPWHSVLRIAEQSLAGEVAAAERRWDAAVEHLRRAAALEDGLPYMEPPYWYKPVRHRLGAVLLQADRPAEAEAVYRQDLQRFPDNGWALRGLTDSLYAQGQDAEARQIAARYRAHWGRG